MSLRLDEAEDNSGDHSDHSKRDMGDEANFAEELTAKDVASPQLSKKRVMEAKGGAKRVDKISSNMNLNRTILVHYHKELLEGGT